MQDIVTPVCYFPTTVLFIDDKKSFLEGISLNLPSNLSYRLFDSPIKTLDFLNRYKPDPFTNRCLSQLEENTFEININCIHKEIYRPERFEEIQVIVVDYAMPGINGLELCEKTSTHFKKILLTGEADESLGIKALNKKIIHHFIRKNEDNLVEDLNQTILEMQFAHFQEISKPIISNLNKKPGKPYHCLEDQAFYQFFKDLIQKNNIIEYYLIDNPACFIMLDINGTCSFLITKSNEDLDTYYNAARDDGASDEILKALKEEKKIPYFGDKNFWEINAAEWKNYLYPSKKLEGENQEYFYAIINKPKNDTLDHTKVLSYGKYLSQQY